MSPHNSKNRRKCSPAYSRKHIRQIRPAQCQLGGIDKKKCQGGKGSIRSEYQDFSYLTKTGAADFLIKTYEMISNCDPRIGGWSADGEYIVLKDTKIFLSQEIPKFFKQKYFSSFTRQLTFYGFKKNPKRQIRLSEFDKSTSKHEAFYHENFKRGKPELLVRIKRSTNNGRGSNCDLQEQLQEQKQEIKVLTERVAMLEELVGNLQIFIQGKRTPYSLPSSGLANTITSSPANHANTSFDVEQNNGAEWDMEAIQVYPKSSPSVVWDSEPNSLKKMTHQADQRGFSKRQPMNHVSSPNAHRLDSNDETPGAKAEQVRGISPALISPAHGPKTSFEAIKHYTDKNPVNMENLSTVANSNLVLGQATLELPTLDTDALPFPLGTKEIDFEFSGDLFGETHCLQFDGDNFTPNAFTTFDPQHAATALANNSELKTASKLPDYANANHHFPAGITL